MCEKNIEKEIGNMNVEEKYEKLLNYFREISKVPWNSCYEEKIADYICNFAKKEI